MNFDRVAPHYRWLETLVFGNQLQAARIAFVRQIKLSRHALIVGEGDGRFLAEFVRLHPEVRVDCIEASAQMIEAARRKADAARVRFIQADIRQIALEPNSYDLIVTHFFLDCFSEKMLPEIVRTLARAATPDAQWLIADFCEPPSGWPCLRARILIAMMYFFFRAVAGIEARRLADYAPLLQAHGFIRTNAVVLPNEMIRSEVWQRR